MNSTSITKEKLQFKSLKEKIEFIHNEYLPKLTKDEADLIFSVLKWDDDLKAAFMLAKSYFEEE